MLMCGNGSANDAVLLRGRQALEMIRDAQSLANELISKSSMSATAGKNLYGLPALPFG